MWLAWLVWLACLSAPLGVWEVEESLVTRSASGDLLRDLCVSQRKLWDECIVLAMGGLSTLLQQKGLAGAVPMVWVHPASSQNVRACPSRCSSRSRSRTASQPYMQLQQADRRTQWAAVYPTCAALPLPLKQSCTRGGALKSPAGRPPLWRYEACKQPLSWPTSQPRLVGCCRGNHMAAVDSGVQSLGAQDACFQLHPWLQVLKQPGAAHGILQLLPHSV